MEPGLLLTSLFRACIIARGAMERKLSHLRRRPERDYQLRMWVARLMNSLFRRVPMKASDHGSISQR